VTDERGPAARAAGYPQNKVLFQGMKLDEYFGILRAVGETLRQRSIGFTSIEDDEPFLTIPGTPGGFDILHRGTSEPAGRLSPARRWTQVPRADGEAPDGFLREGRSTLAQRP
jgi:hypothetical protein